MKFVVMTRKFVIYIIFKIELLTVAHSCDIFAA